MNESYNVVSMIGMYAHLGKKKPIAIGLFTPCNLMCTAKLCAQKPVSRHNYGSVFLLHRECLECALEIHEKLHCPSIAAVPNNIQNTWKDSRDRTKAVRLHQESLAIAEEIYGTTDLKVGHQPVISILM